MDRKVLKLLYDIKLSIESINDFTKTTVSFEEYTSNKLLKRAVEREFEIIGEALNNSIKIDKNLKINNYQKIISFRNYLIHGYSDISDKVVYSIILKDLKLLEDEVTNLLGTNK
ncbi:MAG: DUF86 domain-containing protein [Spirochaetales bacterium]|nr:DUF86 domain-containing protein [Spirochaetales bacterium]